MFKDEIEDKARSRNLELGFHYYSENMKDYVYVDTVVYEEFDLLYFICRKSKSSISIKISK